MRKFFIFFLTLAILMSVFLGCERGSPILRSTPSPEPMSRDITIGVVLPQTGSLGPGEFGPGALVMENGFNMALEEINASGMLGDATLTFIVESLIISRFTLNTLKFLNVFLKNTSSFLSKLQQ